MFRSFLKRKLPIAIAAFFLVNIPLGILMHFGHKGFEDRSGLSKEALLDWSPTLVFAGDSRSQRHLVPKVASRVLGLGEKSVVNLGNAAADPLMFLSTVIRNPKAFENATVVLSISANQLNDGALKRGYFSKAMISRMTYTEQFGVFFPGYIKTLQDYYQTAVEQLFSKGERLPLSAIPLQGFLAIDGVLNPEEMNIFRLKKNPWYKSFNIKGLKASHVAWSLSELNSRCGKILVFSAPFAPSYLKAIEGDELELFEKDFQDTLSGICQKIGILYAAFDSVEGLDDKHFYDSSHLNRSGAELFTEWFVKSSFFQRESSLIRPKN